MQASRQQPMGERVTTYLVLVWRHDSGEIVVLGLVTERVTAGRVAHLTESDL